MFGTVFRRLTKLRKIFTGQNIFTRYFIHTYKKPPFLILVEVCYYKPRFCNKWVQVVNVFFLLHCIGFIVLFHQSNLTHESFYYSMTFKFVHYFVRLFGVINHNPKNKYVQNNRISVTTIMCMWCSHPVYVWCSFIHVWCSHLTRTWCWYVYHRHFHNIFVI